MLMRKRLSMAVSSSNANPSHLTPAKPSPDTDQTASRKPFSSPITFPFFTDRKPRPTRHNKESGAVGLGIIGALRNERPDINRKPSNQESRMVHFGSQLKVQVPALQPTSISKAGWAEVPCSPIEFGVKNKNSQLALLSPALGSPMAWSAMVPPLLPTSAMELSEDYTCVIAHGPNPRTTHIFDNCIVKSCGSCHSYVPSPMEQLTSTCQSNELLTFCHACMKSIGPGKDIFMSRGEKAFCSSDCQYKEMVFDEDLEKASSGSSAVLLIKPTQS